MEKLSRKLKEFTLRPVNILQFGEGNFLRAFVDDFIDILNESGLTNNGVCVIQPMALGRVRDLEAQDGLYTLILEGKDSGEITSTKKIVSCLSDFVDPFTEYQKYLEYGENKNIQVIISNTTESGIVYNEELLDTKNTPLSFPGKLLILLRKRFLKLGADSLLDILCCELIDNNATTLSKVLVELAKYNKYEESFIEYILNQRYYNSLVDRIVPGFPKDDILKIEKENNYLDSSIVKAEPFHLWVIESKYTNLQKILPFGKTSIHAYYVDAIYPYKEQKVKVLNGSHTLLVPVSYLLGHREVKNAISDKLVKDFVLKYLYEEVLDTINLDKEKLISFKDSVIERFENPFIHHLLISIALNSISKYEARILISISKTYGTSKFPKYGLLGLVGLIRLYKGVTFNGEIIPLNDDPKILEHFKKIWATNDYKYIVSEVINNYYSKYELFKDQKVVDYLVSNLEKVDNNKLIEVLQEIVYE
ncbi:MAG: tagaturonate reductase [Acholeplasmatales bacterium]|jgi:tagaturonate reductase|nr:tagaturonate reductase [Acholeplasmatales bacterium]